MLPYVMISSVLHWLGNGQIFDGSDVISAGVGSFSGGSLPPSVVSTGQDMLIQFSSDGTIAGLGWHALVTSKYSREAV